MFKDIYLYFVVKIYVFWCAAVQLGFLYENVQGKYVNMKSKTHLFFRCLQETLVGIEALFSPNSS